MIIENTGLSEPTDTARVSKTVLAVPITGSVSIDGMLSEAVWHRAGFEDFVQSDPIEGAPPGQRTEVWVAYDASAIYIGARLYDRHPDSISARLARRDDFIETDKFTVYMDGYKDGETGNFFTVTASGVQIDGVLYNDEWNNTNWDGVWESGTQIDDRGWTLEMRIPFSQLKFHDVQNQTWGINFRRDVARNNERDFLAYRPRDESGFVSRFGDLVGIRNIHARAGMEVIPYITTRAEYAPANAGDPFHAGSDYLPGAGFDIKTTVAGNLSLTATVNPDFGQVEVDPDVVNLSDFETFFPEKRPFFVEGSSIFRFGNGGANNNWSFNFPSPNLFYSRRIGRPPQGSLPNADFVDAPIGTHILGAGKLSGKLNENLTVGMLHTLTNREYARLSQAGTIQRTEVEPYTYYGILRAQQNIQDRRYGIGLMLTGVRRFFGEQRLRSDLNSSAYVLGLDGWAFLDADREYVITGWAAGSRVTGSEDRMTALQRSSSHYFQRPDASHVSVDSSATSLVGSAFRIALNKQEGPVMLNAAIGAIDPGFDPNDAGFIWRTDLINGHIATGYKWSEPTDWYRSVAVRIAAFSSFDFEWNRTWLGYWSAAFIKLPSYWSISGGAVYNPPSISNRSTRGGPLMQRPDGIEVFGRFESDTRKKLSLESSLSSYQGGGGNDQNLNLGVKYRPTDGLELALSPGYGKARSDRQWVTSYDDQSATGTYGRRYVFADFDQETFSTTLRLNWVYSSEISLQLYTQVLFSSGEYTNLKSLANSGTDDFMVYGTEGSVVTPTDGPEPTEYLLDADGPGIAPVAVVSNPNFNRTSVRGNAVLRWQYAPGSALFLVWSQSRWSNEQTPGFTFRQSMNRLALAPAENIFMLKLTYWWNS
jgi:hypothetical protein